MKTITLELTQDVAKQMLPTLERQQRQLLDQAAAIGTQIDLIQKGLRKPEPEELFIPKLPRVAQTKHGRAKKGETEKIVSEFLQNVNGQGAKIVTIAKSTSTKYGSVRRILNLLSDKGDAKEREGLWFWNA